MTSLENKAIDIKGKKYVLVSDRIIEFNKEYKNGAIRTEKLEADDRVEIKATVIPDIDKPERYFTGHSQAVWGDGMVNKTAALENAETSAVGRALAMMGIGVIDSVASVDEINKATHPQPAPKPKTTGNKEATPAQKKLIKDLMNQKGITLEDLATDGIVQGTPPREVIEYLLKAETKIEKPAAPVASEAFMEEAKNIPI